MARLFYIRLLFATIFVIASASPIEHEDGVRILNQLQSFEQSSRQPSHQEKATINDRRVVTVTHPLDRFRGSLILFRDHEPELPRWVPVFLQALHLSRSELDKINPPAVYSLEAVYEEANGISDSDFPIRTLTLGQGATERRQIENSKTHFELTPFLRLLAPGKGASRQVTHAQELELFRESLKNKYLDECLGPIYQTFQDLLKVALYKQFGGETNPALGDFLSLLSTAYNSISTGDFAGNALQTLLASLLKASFPRGQQISSKEEMEVVSKQGGFWPSVFNSVIGRLDGIPALELLKNFLTFTSTIYGGNNSPEGKEALKNVGEYFLDYLQQGVDNTRWSEDYKSAFKDSLQHFFPGLIKRITSHGDEELSNTEKAQLLKSIIRLFIINFNVSDSTLSLVDEVFSGDRLEEDIKKDTPKLLQLILNIMLDKFPANDIDGGVLGGIGASKCLDSLKYLISGISDNLVELLEEKEDGEWFG